MTGRNEDIGTQAAAAGPILHRASRIVHRVVRLPLVLPVLLAVLSPAANALDRAEDQSAPPPRPLDGQRLAGMEGLAAEAERIRGLRLRERPPWRLRTRSELHRLLVRNANAKANPRRVELTVRLGAALGFWKPDFDLPAAQLEMESGFTRAFYDRTGRDLTLVRPDEDADSGPPDPAAALWEDAEVVHEYTHALQDQNLDIGRLDLAGDSDRAAASRALLEGDAVLTMFAYWIGRSRGRDEETRLAPLTGVLEAQREAWARMLARPPLDRFPRILGAVKLFSYAAGSAFAEAVYKRGGWAELNRCYKTPPLSTEQILHPEKYLRPVPEDPVKVCLPKGADGALKGAQLLDADTAGEMQTAEALRVHLPEDEALAAAAGWGGDLCAIYQRTEGPARGQVVPVWLSAWDSEADAKEFEAAYAKAAARKGGAEKIERRGDAVLIVIGADPAEVEALSALYWTAERRAPEPRRR